MLLNSMKQVPIENTKRRQVSSAATVIPSEEAITILREKEEVKCKPKNYKRKKKAEEVPVVEDNVAEENIEDIIEKIWNKYLVEPQKI